MFDSYMIHRTLDKSVRVDVTGVFLRGLIPEETADKATDAAETATDSGADPGAYGGAEEGADRTKDRAADGTDGRNDSTADRSAGRTTNSRTSHTTGKTITKIRHSIYLLKENVKSSLLEKSNVDSCTKLVQLLQLLRNVKVAILW